jgi:hypothetical protein
MGEATRPFAGRSRTNCFFQPPGLHCAQSLASARSEWLGVQEARQLRKVHHPKIVQRSDGRWMVACDDCARDRGSTRAVGIGDAVDSFEAAERIWEGHVERRIPPIRRDV